MPQVCSFSQNLRTIKFPRGPSNTNSRDAQEIYPVNDIAFHPNHTGLLATTGSDGKYTFWDKVAIYVFLASENFI